MAERLGRSLQNFVQWFKSACDLKKILIYNINCCIIERNDIVITLYFFFPRVAELVDASVSKTDDSDIVSVRFRPWGLYEKC